MNALSLLMMFALFAPVSMMVVANLMLYREARYTRQPAMPAAPAARPVAAYELPAEAYELQRAYEQLRKAA
jgi:hypothetical protein